MKSKGQKATPVIAFSVVALLASLGCITPQVARAADSEQNAYRAPTSFAGKTVVLPIGTSFEGRIQKTIGSRVSRPGEPFTIEISAPVMANGTEVLIPSGAEVHGEVAEAISSSSQPKENKNMKYHPLGIMRIQLNSLKMPDGMSYPLVASFAPDAANSRRHGGGDMSVRKSSVAYVGTQAGFDAVNPGNRNRNRRNGGVLGKGDIMSDPILGDSLAGNSGGRGVVRSLVKRGRDLYIMSGSSITIKLDGPLKIAFGASNAQTSIETMTEEEPVKGGKAKHFSKNRSKQKEEDTQEAGGGQQANSGQPQGGQQQQQGQTQSAPGSDF